MVDRVDLSPAERLIVAADFRPDLAKRQGRDWVRGQVLSLAAELEGTGVYIKMNSILRACGYDLISKVRGQFGLKFFADLKLIDISETLLTDAMLLAEFGPEIVTVSCSSSLKSLSALKAELPHTEVLGVTVPTDFDFAEVSSLHHCSIREAVLRFADVAAKAGLDGVVCAPSEVVAVRRKYAQGFTVNVANVRRNGFLVDGDDQSPERAFSAEGAMKSGATRVIVGRPILQSLDRLATVKEIKLEIAAALDQTNAGALV